MAIMCTRSSTVCPCLVHASRRVVEVVCTDNLTISIYVLNAQFGDTHNLSVCEQCLVLSIVNFKHHCWIGPSRQFQIYDVEKPRQWCTAWYELFVPEEYKDSCHFTWRGHIGTFICWRPATSKHAVLMCRKLAFIARLFSPLFDTDCSLYYFIGCYVSLILCNFAPLRSG